MSVYAVIGKVFVVIAIGWILGIVLALCGVFRRLFDNKPKNRIKII